MEDGKLFTENDGLVQIYDQGFCLDNTIVSGRFNSISAIKCQHVNPTKTFSVHVKNNVTREQEELHQNFSSCSHSLNSTFRIAYSVLGGFSLVSIKVFERTYVKNKIIFSMAIYSFPHYYKIFLGFSSSDDGRICCTSQSTKFTWQNCFE